MKPPIICYLSSYHAALASRIQTIFPVAEIILLAQDAKLKLQEYFKQDYPIIGLCASGILIRALAPLLSDKQHEPPVLSVSPDGLSVVPLLGGHHGANDMAKIMASVLGSHAAITTASESMLGFSLDCPPQGWVCINPEMVKPITSALLNHQEVGLHIKAGNGLWLTGSSSHPTLILNKTCAYNIIITDQDEPPPDSSTLIYHPPCLTLGIGCARNIESTVLREAVHHALKTHQISPSSIMAIASIDIKSDEKALQDLASIMDKKLKYYSSAELDLETNRLLNPSQVVRDEVGCYGVAEGAALRAAGANSWLKIPKIKGKEYTIALASSTPATLSSGALKIIGIGPGQAAWRSPEASAAIAACTHLVGYQMYLDLLGALGKGKNIFTSELGLETERAEQALNLAADGHKTALICSGDAGIYALATLVFELIHTKNNPAWREIQIDVIPGISALQAAAARAGAPINHDFCTISLSNLLTPWNVIEGRLKAAAIGDFVICLYNPVSKNRRHFLSAACEILREHRPLDTPVILARQLGRFDEKVTFTTLKVLKADDADMLTTIIIGNKTSQKFTHNGKDYIYTPRGYHL